MKESVSVSLAAVELADYLEKICDTRPAILAESKAATQTGPRIFIGACQATLKVIKVRCFCFLEVALKPPKKAPWVQTHGACWKGFLGKNQHSLHQLATN